MAILADPRSDPWTTLPQLPPSVQPLLHRFLALILSWVSALVYQALLGRALSADEASAGQLACMYMCTYNSCVTYQWDTAKAVSNLQKHGVAFADAVTVLEDNAALTMQDEASEEERFVTLGMDALGRLLVVLYTWRGDDIRVISARKATRAERVAYKG